MKYPLIALGGTFDHFHKGHEVFLHKAFEEGRRVIIGITSQNMVVLKSYARSIEPYSVRKNSIEEYIRQNNLIKRTNIVRLTDPYGPLSKKNTIKAVVVGAYYNKALINKLAKNYKIIIVSPVYARDKKLLSSSRIRSGEIDRNGELYNLPTNDLWLPSKLRERLQTPMGKFFKGVAKQKIPRISHNAPMIITVGDVTTKKLISFGVIPHLSVVDFYVQRKKRFNSLLELGYKKKHNIQTGAAINPSGCITKELISAVITGITECSQTSKHKRVVVVKGEDDLATLAALYRAPLNSVVFYGQPLFGAGEEGIVAITATEEKKNFARSLLSQFTFTP